MPQLKVLISGGGIAGPSLAFWLLKLTNATITIIERAPAPRTSGQAVDIRSDGVQVIRKMGLEAIIKSKHTTEEGLSFVDAHGKEFAAFPSTGDTEKQSLTSEFEILRGDLAEILFDATKNNVEYVFDEYLIGLETTGQKVRATFSNHLPPTEFDIVVGADGMISKTRQIAFGLGKNENNYLRRLGQYAAFFTIPRMESDTRWAVWYNAPGGRLLLFRPDRYGSTRCYVAVTDWDLKRFDGIQSKIRKGTEAQMEWLESEFKGVGWQKERVIEGMKGAEDFYMQEIAQVQMESFVKGRIALLGDAGFCPSPISGMGTTTAIISSYVLAGEISKSPDDVPRALENYQAIMKPFVQQVQNLPPGAPQILNPQTTYGIAILKYSLRIASSWLFMTVFSSLIAWWPTSKKWKLPSYDAISETSK